MKATEWTEAFASGKMDDKLSLLYGNAKATLEQQRQRYVDAIQAYGKMNIYPKRMGIDLLSVSGHKIHGPKGTGFLYIRDKVKVKPIIYLNNKNKYKRLFQNETVS